MLIIKGFKSALLEKQTIQAALVVKQRARCMLVNTQCLISLCFEKKWGILPSRIFPPSLMYNLSSRVPNVQ